MTGLKLSLLGTPVIKLDGKPIIIRRSKVLALLVYLAVSDEPQRRDVLSTLLWPDSGQRVARSSLRRELSHLNKALVGEWLIVEGETIGLRPDFWLDVNQFQHYLARFDRENPINLDALDEAVALYRDDFLSGFTLPDCPGFDEWQFFQTESLREALAAALEDLVLGLSQQGDYDAAIAPARRWLALDPLHEPVHQVLMRLYAFSGRQAAALRQYSECQRILEAELGVEPEAETQALATAIREKRLVRPVEETPVRPGLKRPDFSPTVTGPEAPVHEIVTPRPVFIGREQQINELVQALTKALSGQGQLRIISGEAGAGKSALITEFLYQAQSDKADLIVAIGTTDAQTGRGDPFMPFREALLGLVRGTATERATASLALLEQGPDVAESFIPASDLPEIVAHARAAGWQGQLPSEKQTTSQQQPIEQSKLIEQYVAVLSTLAAQTPLILILEDLHWADSASLGLFFRLGRQVADSRLLILGTYRVEQTPRSVPSVDDEKGPPLKQIEHELQRHLGEIMIDLEAVRRTEGRSLVDGLLDAEPNQLNESFRQALHRQTGGHPLFVVELLQELKRSAALVRAPDGRWTVGAKLDWQTLPARVEGAIAGRTARLSEEQQWWLTIASVSGEHFYGEVVAQVAGVDPRELAQALSRILQSQHRLVEAEGVERLGQQRLSRYRFRHNLIQVYLYEHLDEVQRVCLHEDVAQALEALYGAEVEQIALQLARHYHRAGIAEKAVDYLILAGEQAVQVAANEAALEHFTQAQTLLPERLEKTARQRQALRIEFNRGRILSAIKGVGTAESGEAYARALALSRLLGETQKTIEILRALTEYAQLRSDLDMAQRYGQECLRLAETIHDPEQLMEINRTLGTIAHWLGQHAAGVVHGDHIIAFYRNHRPNLGVEDAYILATTMAGMCTDLVPLGYPDRALRQAQEGLALIRAHEHQLGITTCLIFAAYVHLFRGDWQKTVQYAAEGIDVSSRYDFYQMRLFAEVLQGVALTHLGQAELGINQVRQAIAGREAINTHFGNGLHLAFLAEACGAVGRVAEGLDLVNEGLALVIRQNERPQQPKLYQIRGDLLLLQNLPQAQRTMARQEAETCFRQAIEIAQSQGAKLWEVRALASLCRLMHRHGRDEGCRQQLADLYTRFTEGFETEALRVVLEVLED